MLAVGAETCAAGGAPPVFGEGARCGDVAADVGAEPLGAAEIGRAGAGEVGAGGRGATTAAASSFLC
jgi:hypothetical protein